MALDVFRVRRPRRRPRHKDRKPRAELVRLIQSTVSGANDVIGFEILHVVDRRVDKQAATAASTESSIDCCVAICDHLVAVGGRPDTS